MARTDTYEGRRSRKPGARRGWRQLAKRLGRTYGFLALAAVLAFGFAREEVSAPRIVSLWQPAAAPAVAPSRPFPICSSGARVDCIVDGDMFWFSGEKVRIADVDTPEISSPGCRRELELGERAKRRLHQLMNGGPVELRKSGRERDRYGRLLRTVHRDGRSVGDILVAEGLAHRWTGRKQSWCG